MNVFISIKHIAHINTLYIAKYLGSATKTTFQESRDLGE